LPGLKHRIISSIAVGPEGWSRDVSVDIAGDIINRADDADETLTEGTKHFIGTLIRRGAGREIGLADERSRGTSGRNPLRCGPVIAIA
jgi:hypothetical protein